MRTTSLSIVLALVGSLASAGCSGENAAAPPPPPVDWHAFDVPHVHITAATGPTPKERAAASSYATAMVSADMAAIAPLLDNDVHFVFAGGRDTRGKEAAIQAHQRLFGAFDKRVMELTRVWRTDGEQTVEWTMAGVQTRDWMGVPATNKPVVIKGTTLLFTKDEGTLSELHVYFDVAAVKVQLGAGPKELAALVVPAMATGEPQIIDQMHSSEETHDVETIRKMLDAFESDEAGFENAFADEVVIESPSMLQSLHGRKDAKAYFRQLHSSIRQIDTVLQNTWGIGPYVVAEYFISGGQTGPIEWVPAQHDRSIQLAVLDIMEMRNGKVAHVWRYENPASLIEAP